MTMRRSLYRAFWAILVASLATESFAATYRTKNFVVNAPTQQIAQQIGQYAEHYRKEKARYWLGEEMPTWGRPCPLKVNVTMGGSGGATTFMFDRGQILNQEMQIEGKLDRLLASVLPHEVTHTVLAYQFRQPVPRWADEGGSVLSEDQLERSRHDRLVRNLLNARKAMPLRRLFTLRDYPREVMTLYAQGYSVTAFLVGRKGPRVFLRFIGQGMQQGWDASAKANYGYRNVEELEEAWLQDLARTRPGEGEMIARGDGGSSTRPVSRSGERPRARLASEMVVRQTAPPTQPLLPQHQMTARGQSPTDELPPRYERRPAPRSASRPRVQLGAPQPIPQQQPEWWSPYER